MVGPFTLGEHPGLEDGERGLVVRGCIESVGIGRRRLGICLHEGRWVR